MQTAKIPTLRFIPLLILAMLVNILAQAVHETGHHMVYQVMGHEPVWAFTKLVQKENPAHPSDWVEITTPDGSSNWLYLASAPTGKTEKAILAAAGPLLGLLSAILGLFVNRRSANPAAKQAWLAYVITISLVATLYYLRAPLRTGGDEYDIATQLGVAKSLIEIPFALGYLACLSLALRQLADWRTRLAWLGTILLGSILTGIPMALLDPIIINGVDIGNPAFMPVLGYSLPVFLTIALTLVGVWAWIKKYETT